MTIVTGRFFLTLAGWAIFNGWGAVVGFIIGWWLDRKLRHRLWPIQPKVAQMNTPHYRYLLFVLMGHLAKADGHVSDTEIQWATSQMRQLGLSNESMRKAQQWFRQGRDASDLKPILRLTLKHLSHAQRRHICWQLATIFQHVPVHPEQQMRWFEIAQRLGLSRKAAQKILRHNIKAHSDQVLAHAYRVLDITEKANEQQVKRAYRRKMMQLHPDRLQAKGANRETICAAAQQIKEIQDAYRTIMTKLHQSKPSSPS